ncbi:MAG TPA: hypothetical protein VF069_05310 [Streptosporangiaceae bacterium]
MMAVYNINAARAQRLEALGHEWKFELDGEVFMLPTEFSRTFAKQVSELPDNDLDGLLRLLLGPDQFERFCAHEVSVQDVAGLLEAYGKDTGMTLGESSASTHS